MVFGLGTTPAGRGLLFLDCWNVSICWLENVLLYTYDHQFLYTGWAITYGNFREIASRLQTKTGTVILRPFLKCPAFLHLEKYKK